MALLGAALTGCGSHVSTTGADDPVPVRAGATTPVGTTTSGPDMTGIEAPPPFRVRADDQEIVLRPYAFCFRNGCADGAPTHVVSVGSPAEVHVFVPVDGWDLEATVTTGDVQCGRRQTVRPDGADGWYVLRPVGRAGDQRVDLFARGDGGDMIAAFDWRTTADGALPEPEAVTALIADHDGRPDSYGVELTLSNLASTPESATARVTVTAANGSATDLRRAPVVAGLPVRRHGVLRRTRQVGSRRGGPRRLPLPLRRHCDAGRDHPPGDGALPGRRDRGQRAQRAA